MIKGDNLMKSLLLILILSTSLSTFAKNIEPGDAVETNYNSWANVIRVVKSISGKRYHMEDGTVFHLDDISPLFETRRGIKVGDRSETHHEGISKLRIVKAISRTRYYMEDNTVYHYSYVSPLFETRRGISVGDQVEIYNGKYIIKTVKAISRTRFYMEDGSVYHSDHVNPIRCSSKCN